MAKEIEKRMENLVPHTDRIDLNLGGTKFSASKSTLLSMEGTYFFAMLSSGRWKPNSEGNVYDDLKWQENTLLIEIRPTFIAS